MRIKKGSLSPTLLACFVLLSLSACGVKPSSVEPPEKVQETPFPRTYPAPSTQH